MSDEEKTIALARMAADERTPANERANAGIGLAKRLASSVGAAIALAMAEDLPHEKRGEHGTEAARAVLRLLGAQPEARRRVKRIRDPQMMAENEALKATVAQLRQQVIDLEYQVTRQQNDLGIQSAQLVGRDQTIMRLEARITQSQRDLSSIHQALNEADDPPRTTRRR